MQLINSLVFVYDGLIYATKSFAFVRKLMLAGALLLFAPLLAGGWVLYRTLFAVWVAKAALNAWRCAGAVWLIEVHFRPHWQGKGERTPLLPIQEAAGN